MSLPARGADWPQWRGPGRDSVWREQGLPDRFPADGLSKRWRQPIGGGYAGIAVAAGRVYTMDRQTEPREVERVLCFNARTGKRIWIQEYPVSYGKMQYGNGPRSTPTVDASRVFTFGAVGHLSCFDAQSGKIIWRKDTVKECKGQVPMWGHACSPLVDGERLIVQLGAEDGCVMAFNKANGKEIWRTLSDRPGYSSPIMITVGQRRVLVYWTPEHVAGLDPVSGKVLWQIPFNSTYDVSISDPVWHGGVLLVSGYWEGSKAIRLNERGEQPEVLWEGKKLSLLMSTPLYRDGYVYGLDNKNGLKCVELQTGAVKWDGQHVTPKSRNPQASLVWAGDRALIFNELGQLLMAQLSPDGYREVSKTGILPGGTWANPAFADGCIFARDDVKIVCVPLVRKR
jgi:outer membrane protein assembly factor BamB